MTQLSQQQREKQLTDSFFLAALLSLSGGLQDAYTYIMRDQVFANAQTGNIVLMSQHIFEKNWHLCFQYILPVLSFALGIFIAELIRQKEDSLLYFHWQQWILLIEILLLFVIGFLPESRNSLANSVVSFSCALQVQSFRKINGQVFASTMCIGNLRSAMESLLHFLLTKDHTQLKKTLLYIRLILLFAIGAGMGSVLSHFFGMYAIWASPILLTICFLYTFVPQTFKTYSRVLARNLGIL